MASSILTLFGIITYVIVFGCLFLAAYMFWKL